MLMLRVTFFFHYRLGSWGSCKGVKFVLMPLPWFNLENCLAGGGGTRSGWMNTPPETKVPRILTYEWGEETRKDKHVNMKSQYLCPRKLLFARSPQHLHLLPSMT